MALKPSEDEFKELDELALQFAVALTMRNYGTAKQTAEEAYDFAVELILKRNEIRKTVGEKVEPVSMAEALASGSKVMDGGRF